MAKAPKELKEARAEVGRATSECEGFKGLTHGVKRIWYSYLKGIQVASVLQAWSPACGTHGAW